MSFLSEGLNKFVDVALLLKNVQQMKCVIDAYRVEASLALMHQQWKIVLAWMHQARTHQTVMDPN